MNTFQVGDLFDSFYGTRGLILTEPVKVRNKNFGDLDYEFFYLDRDTGQVKFWAYSIYVTYKVRA